ncbi:MAG: hypothetical protein LBO81_00325 [Clostridiales Family XIII bacterium]|jgi:cell filamentation protein|nr:hypothetical protein [Clostridiales Family XIII bacterium]
MGEPQRRRQFAFDLDTHRLKEVFGGRRISEAYDRIESFLTSRGFLHEQGSVYVTARRMEKRVAYEIFEELIETHPWIESCARKFNITDVGRTYDLFEMLAVMRATEKHVNESEKPSAAETAERESRQAGEPAAHAQSPSRSVGQTPEIRGETEREDFWEQ